MKRGLQHARNADASVERTNLNRAYEKKETGIPGHGVGFAFAPRKLILVEPRIMKTEPRASMETWLRKGATTFHGSLGSYCNIGLATNSDAHKISTFIDPLNLFIFHMRP